MSGPFAHHVATLVTLVVCLAGSVLPGSGAETPPTISVSDHGAVGDGVTDDTAAIQAAIDAAKAAGGGVVLFPPTPREYIVTKTLRIDADALELRGYGATIKLADHAGDNAVVDVLEVVGTEQQPVDGVVIAGLTVDGNYWEQTEGGQSRCLDVDFATRAVVQDVHFTRGWVCMTFGKGCSQCTAMGCTATQWHNDAFDASGDGVSGGCASIAFIDCHARGAPSKRDGGLPGGRDDAWEIEDGAQGIYLVNCSVENAGGKGFGIRNHAGHEAEVTENINFINCSARGVSGLGWYVNSLTETNVTRGLRLIGCDSDAPVSLNGTVEDITISGRFDGGVKVGSPGRSGATRRIALRGVQTSALSIFGVDVELSNVAVVADGAHGIDVHDGSSHIRMAGCTVSGATDAGIRCTNASPLIANTIVWGNGKSFDLVGTSRPTVTHCCIQGGLPARADDAGGNTAGDPMFVESAVDCRLRPESPCIGAGLGPIDLALKGGFLPTRDVEGNVRPAPPGSRPDMGAWESGR